MLVRLVLQPHLDESGARSLARGSCRQGRVHHGRRSRRWWHGTTALVEDRGRPQRL
jgi:hypothetical protein